MAKKYKLINQQLKPLGQGLGGQVSNLGHALIIWDIGPRAETKALAQAQREMFFNLQPGQEIEAFGQKLIISELDPEKLEMIVEPAPEGKKQEESQSTDDPDDGSDFEDADEHQDTEAGPAQLGF